MPIKHGIERYKACIRQQESKEKSQEIDPRIKKKMFLWDMGISIQKKKVKSHVIHFHENKASRKGTTSCDSEKADDLLGS